MTHRVTRRFIGLPPPHASPAHPTPAHPPTLLPPQVVQLPPARPASLEAVRAVHSYADELREKAETEAPTAVVSGGRGGAP